MRFSSFVLMGLSAAMLPACAFAGSVALHGISDDNSRYIEPASDAEMVVGDYWYNPDTGLSNQQRLHKIGDPGIVYGSNPSFDGFPNDGNFRFGRVTFDDAGLGGNGVATITGLTLSFDSDPEDPAYINMARWTGVVTTVDSFSGTVTLVDGTATSMNLTANITIFIPSAVNVQVPGSGSGSGTFIVTDNYFTGDATVNTSAFAGINPEGGYFWDPATVTYDLQGVITSVPEPVTAGLAMLGLLVGKRRRRNGKGR